MKFNKILSSVTILTVSTLLLTACGGNKDKKETSSSSKTEKTTKKENTAKKVAGADLKDGTYKLEEKNYTNGYRAVFELTVKDGKITKSNFDYVNKDGKSKKEDKDYNKNMKAKAGVGPDTYIDDLNKSLEEAQTAGNVEVVTGATHSSESFQNYAQQLIQAAQAGDTKTIEIDNGAKLKDGTYKLEEKNYSNGYRTVFELTVKDGKITKSAFDYINKDGKSKKEDKDYNKNMKAKTGVGPATYIDDLNKGLEEKQAPADVEVVTGATHSSHAFIMYAEQLVNAAEKGDTTPITVDNIVTSN